jgi:hypothetical protein
MKRLKYSDEAEENPFDVFVTIVIFDDMVVISFAIVVDATEELKNGFIVVWRTDGSGERE